MAPKNSNPEDNNKIPPKMENLPIEPATTPPVPVGELLKMDFPPQKWLVRNLIPAGGLTLVSAPPNSYKTLSMTHLAICAASGKPFFGHFTTTQCGVLLVDEENGSWLVQKQLKDLGATEELPILIRTRHNVKLTPEHVGVILIDCLQYNLKLVVFDSLIDMHSANENDPVEMGAVISSLKILTEKDISVIVLHHDRKPGQNYRGGGHEMRGSSNIYAQADAHISLNRKGDTLVVTPTKLRYAPELKAFGVMAKYDEKQFVFEYVGGVKNKQEENEQLIRDTIVKLLEEHKMLSKKEILAKLKEQKIKVNEHSLKKIMDGMEPALLDSTTGLGNTRNYFLVE